MNLQPNQIVALIFVIGTIGVYLYEVWALAWKDESWTITNVLSEWSKQFPILPLAVGVLMGHLFFCRGMVNRPPEQSSIEIKGPTTKGVEKVIDLSQNDIRE